MVVARTPEQHEVYRHAKAGNLEKLRYWVEDKNFPIDKQDFYSATLLYYACLCNHADLVRYLLSKGAAFSRKNWDGMRIYLASPGHIRDILLGRYTDEEKPVVVVAKNEWFEDSLNNSHLADVSFVVEGTITITAHKAILAARCPNLIHKMELKNTITMGNVITREIFTDIMKHAYTDKLQVKDEDRKKLSKIAAGLGSVGLENKCKVFSVLDNFEEGDLFSIGHSMMSIFNNDLFSDITLTTEDGGSFFAHKIILINRSDYFRALFSSEWTESQSLSMEIQGVTKDIFKIILQYLYSGMFEVNETNISELLLEREILKNYTDLDSCMELITFADVTNCSRLFKACEKIILNNFATLSSSKGYADLPPEIRAKLEVQAKKKKLTSVDLVATFGS